MNARVAAGFPPRHGAHRGRIRTFLTTRPQLAAMGAAASLLIALIVALSAIGDGGTRNSALSTTAPASSGGGAASSGAGSASSGGSASSDAESGPATEQAAPDSNSAAAPAQKAIAPSSGIASPSPVPPGPGGFVGGRSRKVEQSASLVLAAPQDKLSDVGDQVIAVTDRYRGIVMRSSVTSAGEGSSGTFDLRMPLRNLRPALRDLSALADVKSRTENADDVTASFVSARTRLEELNAERRGLLRRLEKAATDQAAAAVRARIRIVNAQIDAQNQALTDLRRRTSYATVSVTLEPKQGGSGGGGISSGADDLRDSLVDAANLALRVLGVALPIGLVVGLLWLVGGRLTRRRREAVLDQR